MITPQWIDSKVSETFRLSWLPEITNRRCDHDSGWLMTTSTSRRSSSRSALPLPVGWIRSSRPEAWLNAGSM